MKSMFYIF